MNNFFTSLVAACEGAMNGTPLNVGAVAKHSNFIPIFNMISKQGHVFAIIVFVISLSVVRAQGQEFQRNIMTGSPNGTYIQIGRDLASVSAGCGPTLEVNESAGSLENLIGIMKQRNTQFGIVQSDMLEYIRTYTLDDPGLQRYASGLQVMFPLYNEEIQVLATRGVTRLSDLSGKKVAVGRANSGTFLTASIMLDILQVDDAIRIKIGPADALPKLLSGEIDAVFYVSGVPTKLFSDTTIDGSKFHLLDILEPELLATYTATKIPGGTYPFQPEQVNVVAVRAVLMTYEYKPGGNRYNRQSCKAVSDLSSIILTNLESLKEFGHQKWQDVDLSQLPPYWKVGDCVKAGMAVDYKLSCGSVNSTFAKSGETTKPKASTTASEIPKSFAIANNQNPDGSIQEYLKLLKEFEAR